MPHITDDELLGWCEQDQTQREEIARLRADLEAVCEHGSQKRKCVHCELNGADLRIESLEKALKIISSGFLGDRQISQYEMSEIADKALHQ